MSIQKPLRILILLCLLFCLPAAAHAAQASAASSGFTVELPLADGQTVSIAPQYVGDQLWLFLPAAARTDALTLRFSGDTAELIGVSEFLDVRSGEPFSLRTLLPAGQTRCTLTFFNGEETITFTLQVSDALRSAFITSADPAKGRAYVDADKERKVKGGSFALLREDGGTVWSGELKNIKSRGNSTWSYPKKPYQIKLSGKVDLLETGDAAERESTWLLLADYLDGSLLHNRLTFDLAADFSLAYTPNISSVDLYYDGEYRGVYALCEKTEISGGRVAIHDLEADIEEANPSVADMAELPVADGALDSGLTYRYVSGLNAPANLRGGYLLELDYPTRAEAEVSWFRTVRGQHVVVKSPEYVPEDAMRYIASLYERFENAVYAGGVDPVTWTDYRELVDLDSLARCFLIMELAEDNDAFASSTFFYKPSDEGKLYVGPLWDFDTGYGTAGLPECCSVVGGTQLGNRLLNIPSFRDALLACWTELRPLICDIALSDDPDAAGTRLRSLAGYEAELAASRSMDQILWAGSGASGDIAALRERLANRVAWLDEQLAVWCSERVSGWTFADVPRGSWYYDYVHAALDIGLFQGSSAILFQPDAALTRAMAVTVLHRLVGAPEAEAAAAFTDVSPAAWYYEAAAWAQSAGIVSGDELGRLNPDTEITLAQFISMLRNIVRAADASSESESYSGDWSPEAIVWAFDSGLLQSGDGLLNSRAAATRAQASAMLVRFRSLFPALCAIS